MEPTDTGMSRRGVFTVYCLEHSFYISYQHKHIPTYRKNEGTGLIIVWKVFLSSLFRSHFFSFFINYDFFCNFFYLKLLLPQIKYTLILSASKDRKCLFSFETKPVSCVKWLEPQNWPRRKETTTVGRWWWCWEGGHNPAQMSISLSSDVSLVFS